MPKQARINQIKSLRCYTPLEAADIVGVSPRTIRNWARDGLPIMNLSNPPLIRGDALRDFIQGKRRDQKVKTGLCEFYCLSCRKPRLPVGATADCKLSNTRATLTAHCSVCQTVVCKPVALDRLPEIRMTLDLKIKGKERTL